MGVQLGAGVGRRARPPMTLAALASPCGIGSSSRNQLADRRWLSGSRAPPSWMPVGSPTNDPDGALIVPWVSGAASPSTPMAGPEQHRSSLGEAPGLYTPVRDPCVLSVQGVATPPPAWHPALWQRPQTAQLWEAPCAELPTPPDDGDVPLALSPHAPPSLSLPTPFSRQFS